MIDHERIRRGLADIAQDFRYTLEMCENATAKIEKKKLRKQPVIENLKTLVNYCNTCGKPRGWSLTFRRENWQTCNFCSEWKPCSVMELSDQTEQIAAWKLDSH